MSDTRKQAEKKTKDLIETIKGIGDGTGLNRAVEKEGGWGSVLFGLGILAVVIYFLYLR